MNNSHDEKTWLIAQATSSWKLAGKKKEIIWENRWKEAFDRDELAHSSNQRMLIKLVLLSW